MEELEKNSAESGELEWLNLRRELDELEKNDRQHFGRNIDILTQTPVAAAG